MSKSKLSLEDSITLAQNNAIDFTHACVTIALNEKFGIGKERQKKVNAVRDEVNGQVPEVRDFAACCVGFEQYKNQQMREMDGPEARRKAEQVFGRLCWKDAWEELREVRDR